MLYGKVRTSIENRIISQSGGDLTNGRLDRTPHVEPRGVRHASQRADYSCSYDGKNNRDNGQREDQTQ